MTILNGRIGRDPEIKRQENGSVVANFSVATEEFFSDAAGNRQKTTDWHEVSLWGREKLSNILKKGMLINVIGKSKVNEYKKTIGGETVTFRPTVVVADTVRILSKKSEISDEAETE